MRRLLRSSPTSPRELIFRFTNISQVSLGAPSATRFTITPMIKKTLASALAIVLISAISVTGAQAATTTAKAGGVCAKAGSTTTIAGKSYTCTKVLSGKLVWTIALASGAKPQISGGAGGEGGFGEDHGRGNNAALQATLKKYNACLIAHGGTATLARGGFRGSDDGVRPTTPPVQPTLSAAQTKAVAACVTLAPKLPPRGDN